MKQKRQVGVTPRLKNKKFGLNKKLLTPLALFVVFSISGLAAWVLSVQSDTLTGNVVSDPDSVVSITQDFVGMSTIDTTNASVSVNQTLILYNSNGLLNFMLTINETRVDIEDGCTDYENDITTSYTFNGEVVNSGEIVNVTSGNNELIAFIDYEHKSCPQNFTMSAVFDEV